MRSDAIARELRMAAAVFGRPVADRCAEAAGRLTRKYGSFTSRTLMEEAAVSLSQAQRWIRASGEAIDSAPGALEGRYTVFYRMKGGESHARPEPDLRTHRGGRGTRRTARK